MTSQPKILVWSDFIERRSRRKFVELDFVKVVSVLWLLVNHSYFFAIQWDAFGEVDDVFSSVLTRWIANGTFAVDNLFLVSGMLSAMGQRRELRASEPLVAKLLESLRRVLVRYLRLAPSLLLMILFSVIALPESKTTIMFSEWCRRKWPLNAAMAQNFVETPTMCFSHSWYVAVNLQLFILLQSVWLVFYKSSGRSWKILVVVAICSSQVVVALETYIMRLPPLPSLLSRDQAAMFEYYTLLYIKPHYWLSSYLIGALAANNFERLASGRSATQLNSWLSILAPLSLLALILSTPSYLVSMSPAPEWLPSVYALLARPVWSLCVAALLMRGRSCGLTSLYVFTPASKLTYLVYLVHPVLMAIFHARQTRPLEFSHLLVAYLSVGHAFFSFLIAFAVHLAFERPITVWLSRRLRAERPTRGTPDSISLRTRAKNQS